MHYFTSSIEIKMKIDIFKAFRKKKHAPQGGAILDQVISESCSAANKILLYKLANYKLGECYITSFRFENYVEMENFQVEISSMLTILVASMLSSN